MSDHERIWAWTNAKCERAWTGMKPAIAGAKEEQEYVRADLFRDLEERLAKAAEALEPFAKAAEKTTVFNDYETVEDTVAADHITLGDLRRARTALSQIRSEK